MYTGTLNVYRHRYMWVILTIATMRIVDFAQSEATISHLIACRGGKTMYQEIVVALDGSEFAEKVLPHVEALAAKFESNLTLVRARTPATAIIAETSTMSANAPVVVDPTPIIQAEQDETEKYLSGVAQRLSAQGLKV